MSDFTKGELLNEGKTKKIFNITGNSDFVLIENKDDITKYDDPSLTKNFGTKAKYATTTTCRVFEILKKAGIPVAYVEQISANEFVANKCKMIPLEVVARRYAVGSFLKRHPELIAEKGKNPHRFHRLTTEFFLKTTSGSLKNEKGEIIAEGFDAKKGEEDPFILNPYKETWELYHPKKPTWEAEANLNKSVDVTQVLSSHHLINKMEEILRKVFLVLEGMWNSMGMKLIDMKIEFGITDSGELLVADVIDNDSWRLRDDKWEELSKEAFRQGEEISEVEKKYGIVAGMLERYRFPKQLLLLWRGSDKDTFPEIPQEWEEMKTCEVQRITISAHKSPQQCLRMLEEIVSNYPDGGLIIAKVGRSNGLGPVLAARTSLPVVAIPATIDKNPEDIWSSIRMPSLVPLATVWPDSNAVLFAENVLAQKNPVIYMQRELEIEKFDE